MIYYGQAEKNRAAGRGIRQASDGLPSGAERYVREARLGSPLGRDGRSRQGVFGHQVGALRREMAHG